jgi:chromosome segregation ATPase
VEDKAGLDTSLIEDKKKSLECSLELLSRNLKELELQDKDEEELLSRLNERNECLNEENFENEKILQDMKNRSEEIKEEEKKVELELDKAKSNNRILTCNISSLRTSNAKLQVHNEGQLKEIESLANLLENLTTELKYLENSISSGKLQQAYKKEKILFLLSECSSLHSISISDDNKISSLHEDINKLLLSRSLTNS